MDELVTLQIDGREARVPKGTSVIEAAKTVGVAVPAFCYHAKMKAVGACRMCLVEIEKMPKLQTACTTPVAGGMVVHTNSPRAIQAQHSVIEFLLSNHPLDCPVCDKGGECTLQDTTFGWGLGTSRFEEEKRHQAKPIDLSDEIKLDRERCILCLRCVRFTREIAGDESLVVAERGAASEVATVPGGTFDSPFSGNSIEICPVGALTSTRSRFKARSWDLDNTPTVCDKCSVGCNLKLQVRKNLNTLYRLWSRENADVDDGWLCDRGRFDYQYVGSPKRLKTPLIRKGGVLAPASWAEAIAEVRAGFRRVVEAGGGTAVGAIGSARGTNEEAYLLQKLFRLSFGSNNVDHSCRPHAPAAPLPLDAATGSIAELEAAGAILVVGADPRLEQPILSLRLRKAAGNGAKVFSIGPEENGLAKCGPWLRARPSALAGIVSALCRIILDEQSHDAAFVSTRTSGLDSLRTALAGVSPERVAAESGLALDDLRGVARGFAEAPAGTILYRRELLAGLDRDGARELVGAIYNLALLTGNIERLGGGLFPLRAAANAQGCTDVGLHPSLLPGQRPVDDDDAQLALAQTWGDLPHLARGHSGAEMLGGAVRALYLLGQDPVGEGAGTALPALDFLVVQDTFLTETAKLANVVLPAVTFAELDGTFTNLERRIQRLRPGITPPGEARPGWRIVRDVGVACGPGFDFGSPQEVFAELTVAAPIYRGLTYSRLGDRGLRWPRASGGDGILHSPDQTWTFAVPGRPS